MIRHLLLALSVLAMISATPLRAADPPRVQLVAGYATTHPRLLFDAAGAAALAQRSRQRPELWQPVITAAARLASGVPDARTISEGKSYWRSDAMLAGAIAYRVGGDAGVRDGCVAWMAAHCRTTPWGTGWRENVDIPANWYMYYIALAYDILHGDIPAEQRRAIATGLGDHAEAVSRSWQRETEFPYDQNHTYVPMIGLAAAALALIDEDPRAQGWLDFAHDVMVRCRAVLPEDGYYYEGTGYWEYAFHWHVRYAGLIARATGEAAFDLPMLRRNHLYAAHLSLPGPPGFFDIGDTGKGAGRRAAAPRFGHLGMLHGLAAALRDPSIQGVAETLRGRGGEWDDPGMQFLWYDPALPAQPMAQLPTSHRFDDFGVITWRSSWDADATVCMFKCGPPNGYAAEERMRTMPAWHPNAGHAHPDIGMFWLYAGGTYLATDTGYSGRKRSRDHNTILIDGQGMGADDNYWAYSGFPKCDIPYATWMQARLLATRLEAAYAYAVADFSSCYAADLGRVQVRRHFLATRDMIVVYDDLQGDRPHVFSTLVHADGAFVPAGPARMKSKAGPTDLLVCDLSPDPVVVADAPAMVCSFTSPNVGSEEQRGFQVSTASRAPVQRQRFITVLLPIRAGQPDPQTVELIDLDAGRLRLRLARSGSEVRTCSIDLAWRDGDPGPVSW